VIAAIMATVSGAIAGKMPMRPEDFCPEDLFTQIQGLAESVAKERAAREAAEQADKAKSELIATVAEELRTPMETVIAMAELLLASPLDNTQRHYTGTLHHAARSLLGVLDEVLDFSKLEAGRLMLLPSAFDLHELIQSVALSMQARANEKRLTSGVDIGANCPRFIIGDALRVRQVLASLVDHALKTTSEGAVRLYASGMEQDGALLLRFDVTDTGEGLDKAARDTLFRPQMRLVAKGETRASDNGLGLSIARKLAPLRGGEVGCQSVVGKGSLYWFTMRAERPRAVAAPQAPSSALPQPPLKGHLLVVEDNAVNRMLITTYLDEFGLTYELVDSVSGALLSLPAKSFDLVLLDTGMPDLDGIEAAKRIRALQAPAAKVPLVGLVAQAKKSYCGTYLSAGMDSYVLKPIRGRDLYAALASQLKPAESGEDAAESGVETGRAAG
jgi:signal transduction histidine kinase/CheY-like chemotaxis protein